jgi:metal-sulfur cluster biosynthetic enzyme
MNANSAVHDRHRVLKRIAVIVIICACGFVLSWLPRRILSRSEASGGAESNTELSGNLALAEDVRDAISEVMDPELGISVTSLGLIRKIETDAAGKAKIHMILTTAFCPLAGHIEREVRSAASGVDGVGSVEIDIDRSAVWHPDMMSEQAREKLGRFNR